MAQGLPSRSRRVHRRWNDGAGARLDHPWRRDPGHRLDSTFCGACCTRSRGPAYAIAARGAATGPTASERQSDVRRHDCARQPSPAADAGRVRSFVGARRGEPSSTPRRDSSPPTGCARTRTRISRASSSSAPSSSVPAPGNVRHRHRQGADGSGLRRPPDLPGEGGGRNRIHPALTPEFTAFSAPLLAIHVVGEMFHFLKVGQPDPRSVLHRAIARDHRPLLQEIVQIFSDKLDQRHILHTVAGSDIRVPPEPPVRQIADRRPAMSS